MISIIYHVYGYILTGKAHPYSKDSKLVFSNKIEIFEFACYARSALFHLECAKML